MAQLRAKAGGETVGGSFFKGGQFVTNEAQARERGLIGMTGGATFDIAKLLRKKHGGAIRTWSRAAASVRKTAMRSIRRRKGPSSPGSPPHTKTRRLPRSILYDVNKQQEYAIIGPAHHLIGLAGAAHEFGGRFRGAQFPVRSFMRPALNLTLPRLPSMWTGSIHE